MSARRVLRASSRIDDAGHHEEERVVKVGAQAEREGQALPNGRGKAMNDD